jgi:enoyl-CoA hydratase/carnithine racemase
MRLGSVNYETKGKIAILTLDEPAKLNALSPGIREGIVEGLKRVDADHEIRVAIITGSGEKAFCAGADISGFQFDPEAVRNFMSGRAGCAGNLRQTGDLRRQRSRLWRRL